MLINTDYILVLELGQEGYLPEDVAISIKAPSSLAFVPMDLTTENFLEAEMGIYNIVIAKENISELGTFMFQVNAYQVEKIEIREAVVKPYSSTPPPDICLVTGNLRNIAGKAEVFQNVLVSVYITKLPSVISGSMILGKRVDTRTDFDGFFSLPVIRGANVRFEIEKAGVRFTADIPDVDTVRMEDLIP